MKATPLLNNLGGQSLWLGNVLAQFAAEGVDVDALGVQLQEQGAKSFVNSWNELMMVIASKGAALAKAG